jgi:nucleoside-diphosphate-sugar epimerase
MTIVAVVGASGFIGSAVAQALRARGARVVEVTAPRLTSPARSVDALRDHLHSASARAAVDRLRLDLQMAERVVNAAGVSAATSGLDDVLVGANALLPAAVETARPDGARLVHVSSAAVQGRRETLDESWDQQPFSPYSTTKAWGEQLLGAADDAVVFRPTSVHGVGRPVTRSLVRVLRSRWASVAGEGDRPTPQVLVENVGDAIAEVSLSSDPPPSVVLQPGEGLTTAELVRLVGGHEPHHVPVPLARALVAAVTLAGQASGEVAAMGRRVEMLWFGQRQGPSWLDGRWQPPVGLDGWRRLHSCAH